MDGVHDLGGREGFGPIDVDEPEVAFHHHWEGRMWGISKSTRQPDWTIDWWRHVRELIDPIDYLSRPYFDSWAQTQIAAFIDSGVFTLAEIVAGKSATAPIAQTETMTAAEVIAAGRSQASWYDRDIDQAAAFQVGDPVCTKRLTIRHHTRLPAYVRGKPGVIHAHHGAHVFADLSAQGTEQGQHLYSVVFDAGDLWLEATASKDRIFVDLWESYLEPA